MHVYIKYNHIIHIFKYLLTYDLPAYTVVISYVLLLLKVDVKISNWII